LKITIVKISISAKNRKFKKRQIMDDFLTPYEVEHLAGEVNEIPIERFGSPE